MKEREREEGGRLYWKRKRRERKRHDPKPIGSIKSSLGKKEITTVKPSKMSAVTIS